MAVATHEWLPPVGVHKISIGTTIRRSFPSSRPSSSNIHSAHNEYIGMRYNFKPPAVHNASGVIKPTTHPSTTNAYNVSLTSESGEHHSFAVKVQPQQPKTTDCVIFYDPQTGSLILERLDTLLTLTHERQPSGTNQSTTHAHVVAPPRTFPPTPPSNATSPPVNAQQQKQPHAQAVRSSRPQQRAPSPANDTSLSVPQLPDVDLFTGDLDLNDEDAEGVSEEPPIQTQTSLSFGQPQSLSEYAAAQRKLNQRHEEQRTSGFASEPDEEEFTFGEPSRPSPHINALGLSTDQTRKRSRSLEDDGPDEEEYVFGGPSREIKRAKTSHSPDYPQQSTSSAIPGLSLPPQVPQQQFDASWADPEEDIPAWARPPVQYNQQPTTTTTAPESDEDDASEEGDDDSSDSDDDIEQSAVDYYPPTHTAQYDDGDEEDFLLAALGGDDLAPAGMHAAAENSDDDSSDESDYNER